MQEIRNRNERKERHKTRLVIASTNLTAGKWNAFSYQSEQQQLKCILYGKMKRTPHKLKQCKHAAKWKTATPCGRETAQQSAFYSH